MPSKSLPVIRASVPGALPEFMASRSSTPGGIRSIRNQLETDCAAVQNRDAGRHSRITLQQPCSMHADALVREDRVADPYHHRVRRQQVFHVTLLIGNFVQPTGLARIPSARGFRILVALLGDRLAQFMLRERTCIR